MAHQILLLVPHGQNSHMPSQRNVTAFLTQIITWPKKPRHKLFRRSWRQVAKHFLCSSDTRSAAPQNVHSGQERYTQNLPSASGPYSESGQLGLTLPATDSELLKENSPRDPGHTAPKTGVIRKLYFEPANPSFLGYIEEPKGRPSGVGGYSDVWRCSIRYHTPAEALPTEVAVKVIRSASLSGGAVDRLQQRFLEESITWIGLPSHPNIVPLMGWTLTPNLSFISPWYKQGNLYSHLKRLSGAQKLRVLLGVAKGLDFLHSRSPPVIHGDLKPENILLSDRGEPLLADVRLSTILRDETLYTSSHNGPGTMVWMSPECFRGEPSSCQSDVYNFGHLALTVLTGETPYAGLTDGQVAMRIYHSSHPNGPVQDWSKYPQLQGPVKDLLLDCWSPLPSARPSMSVVVRRLTNLLESRESGNHTLPLEATHIPGPTASLARSPSSLYV